jgi:hypothetical protein
MLRRPRCGPRACLATPRFPGPYIAPSRGPTQQRHHAPHRGTTATAGWGARMLGGRPSGRNCLGYNSSPPSHLPESNSHHHRHPRVARAKVEHPGGLHGCRCGSCLSAQPRRLPIASTASIAPCRLPPPQLTERHHATASLPDRAGAGRRQPRRAVQHRHAAGTRRLRLRSVEPSKRSPRWTYITSPPFLGQVRPSPRRILVLFAGHGARGLHCFDFSLSREFSVIQGPLHNFEKILRGPPANVLLGFQLQLRKIVKNRRKIRKMQNQFCWFPGEEIYLF